MSTAKNYKFQSKSSEETEQFAEKLGIQLKGGEIIELIGDVGAGKTTFVRGLARGIGSKDRVTSPTFTVSKVYNSDNISLHHYDFYRLDDLKIIKDQLTEVVDEPKSAIVLEWADEVQQALSPDHIRVKIEVAGEDKRAFTFYVPKNYKYIMTKT